MSPISIFFIIFFYIASLIFILGVSYKLVQYWNTPVPLKIPIAPSSLDKKGVFLRFFREIFLFSSLFKASKWTWLFGWTFHLALVLLFFRHLSIIKLIRLHLGKGIPWLFGCLDLNLDSKTYNLTPAPFRKAADSSKGHLGLAG